MLGSYRILDRNRIETIQGKRIFERLSSLRLLYVLSCVWTNQRA